MSPRRRYTKDSDTGGHLGPALQTQQPAQVAGVEQHGSAAIPARCPKCNALPPTWTVDEYQGHCRCGATWYRTAYEWRNRR